MRRPTQDRRVAGQHVILVHRYFDPDTPPYALILKQLALRLGRDGHRVTVLTCMPSYRPELDIRAPARENLDANVSVVRWPVVNDRASALMKALNMVVFCARALLWIMRQRRVDVVMAATTPPVGVAMTCAVAARSRGAKFVYHKQDIYPDVAIAGPGLPRFLAGGLRWLDTRIDRQATRVVVLSEDMRETVENRGVPREKIVVLNNFDPWLIEMGVNEKRSRAAGSDGAIRIVYAGNLGVFQNLETVFASLRKFAAEPRLAFHFVGDGVMRSDLERLVDREEIPNVTVHGYLPGDQLAEILSSKFDVGIVSVKPGVISAAFPSKTMSYLRSGLPVLCLVERKSELAQMLQNADAGWIADPQFPRSLDDAVRQVLADSERLPKMQSNARALYRSEFDPSKLLDRWSLLFAELTSG